MGSSVWFILWCSCVLCCSWSQTACAETTKQHTSLDGFSLGDIYDCGPYDVTINDKLKSPCCETGFWLFRPPCCNDNLLVAAPKEEGAYPVVQFQHGFLLSGSVYYNVIHQIASWGFIVVAPKMYSLWNIPIIFNAIQEIKDARAILKWLSTGLVPVLSPLTVARPDLEKIALVGHSRGGKVVYGLALNVTSSTITIPQFSAVVGLDPVDGTGSDSFPKGQLQPPVLAHKNNSLHLGVPTLIVGTGLGRESIDFPEWLSRLLKWLLIEKLLKPGPCAPEIYGHKYFFDDVAPPAFHFVVPKQGHMDFCNCTNTKLPLCRACKNEESTRPQMHKFTAGIVVAFLRKALLHNNTAFDVAYEQYKKAPVPLNPPERKLGQIPGHTESHKHASV